MLLFHGSITDQEVEISPDEQHHIQKVLRLHEGAEISVTDGNGNMATGNLQFFGKKVTLNISQIKRNLPDFPHRLHIAIAPTKNIDRTEFFIEKATELGVSEITFLLTENSERKNLNIERIEKKMIAACKQSQRVYFPKLQSLTKLSEFLQNKNLQNTFVAHCHPKLERKKLCEIKAGSEICFLIGPEGDFSPNEIDLLQEKGILGVSLGFQRLRTETAGIFVAAWNYEKMISEI